jgi:thiol-disulfide isomerase/thioredoxin
MMIGNSIFLDQDEKQFESAAAAFTTNDVIFARADVDKYRDLGNRFGVRSYPTLKWFPKGSTTPEEYEIRFTSLSFYNLNLNIFSHYNYYYY